MDKDTIVVNLAEWQTCSPVTDRRLRGLFLEDEDSRSVAASLTDSGLVYIQELREGLSIRSTSYVGRVRLGKLLIDIRPKIDELRLMRLFRYAYGLRDLKLFGAAGYRTEQLAFQDLLIAQLVAEVKELLARGLRKQYRRTDEELSNPRGRIDFQKISGQGGVITATLPCSHHPRLEDCPINQVVLAGLKLGCELASEITIRSDLYHLARLLEEAVSPTVLTKETFRKLDREMNRLTAAYLPAVRIIEILYGSLGITLEEGREEVVLPGFLFDMNRFFQSLVSRFLHENLAGYEVRDEYRLIGMMSYVPGYLPKFKKSSDIIPRPDFAVRRDGKVEKYLDTKYRDLWENPLPREMLYQLAIYALSQEAGGEAVILYPTISSEAREARISINDPIYGTGRCTIIVRPIDMLYFEGLISQADTLAAARERASYAGYLAIAPTAYCPAALL